MHSITLRVFMSLITCSLATAGTYNYNRTDTSKGPGAWSTVNAECGGSENSPINLVSAESRDIGDFTFSNWDSTVTWNSTNNGATVAFVPNSEPWSTTGGGLNGTYIPSQFHLHWGAGSDGSEHTVSGNHYAVELHLIHRRSTYATLGDAVGATKQTDREALAVFGIFFEAQATDNPDIEQLIIAIEAVKNYSDAAYMVTLPSLATTYGTIGSGSYYRYDGGLTTPGCTEIVLWTVFTTPLKIGNSQLARLQATDTGDYGTELYRPVVALGSRTIYMYNPSATIPGTTTTPIATTAIATQSCLALQVLMSTLLVLIINM